MSEIPLLLLILLLIAILLQVDFVFYLVYVLAGSYLLARGWTGRSLPHLQVRRRFTDHIFPGETTRVEIEVKNTSWWPVPWLRLEESPPLAAAAGPAVRQVVSLGPKERLTVHYDLIGRQRGYYPIGPTAMTVGDLFGFAEAQGRFEVLDHLTVYPRVIPLMHADLTSRSPHGSIASPQRIFADPTRVIGKREYRPGDPLRMIDWKSSAHTNTLQVKQYAPAVSLTSMIFLELSTRAYTTQLRYGASEWGIVVAA
ncbi:MAG: DUF58 domain-containing protein, partial [Anaerolineae bacterium]|nr:DUF58 domain-containing protein [Anaerolineae bacterium]